MSTNMATDRGVGMVGGIGHQPTITLPLERLLSQASGIREQVGPRPNRITTHMDELSFAEATRLGEVFLKDSAAMEKDLRQRLKSVILPHSAKLSCAEVMVTDSDTVDMLPPATPERRLVRHVPRPDTSAILRHDQHRRFAARESVGSRGRHIAHPVDGSRLEACIDEAQTPPRPDTAGRPRRLPTPRSKKDTVASSLRWQALAIDGAPAAEHLTKAPAGVALPTRVQAAASDASVVGEPAGIPSGQSKVTRPSRHLCREHNAIWLPGDLLRRPQTLTRIHALDDITPSVTSADWPLGAPANESRRPSVRDRVATPAVRNSLVVSNPNAPASIRRITLSDMAAISKDTRTQVPARFEEEERHAMKAKLSAVRAASKARRLLSSKQSKKGQKEAVYVRCSCPPNPRRGVARSRGNKQPFGIDGRDRSARTQAFNLAVL